MKQLILKLLWKLEIHLKTSGSIVWTPAEAGTYYYQCSAHSGMVGTITVQ